jgi:hypothetical protein
MPCGHSPLTSSALSGGAFFPKSMSNRAFNVVDGTIEVERINLGKGFSRNSSTDAG